MGITDRKYMSEPSRSFGTIRGYDVTALLLLILINLSVWLVWQFALHSQSLREIMTVHFMTSPSRVFNHYYIHTLLTSTVSHIGGYHILFNLLFLWFLGQDVENFYGKSNFLALYIFTGMFSSLSQCGLEYLQGSDVPSLGASGAIMGVAVVAAFVDPRKTINLWGMIPVQLWMLVVIYVILDLSGMLSIGSGIAHAAHLGGACAGLLFYKMDLRVFASRGRKRSGFFYRIGQWWRGRQFRVVDYRSEKDRTKNPESLPEDTGLVSTRKERTTKLVMVNRSAAIEPVSKLVDPETAKRVDQLLEKISREGIGSLNPEEREFLKRSSEKYKR